jgi:TonB-linked SusC/RagA family outer membrane protein
MKHIILTQKACVLIVISLFFFLGGMPVRAQENTTAEQKLNKKKYSVAFGPDISIKESTISASSVTSDEIDGINSPAWGNSLFGKIPGLLVQKSAGSLGNDSPGLMIRGRQTTNDNSMLYLVDGFETKWQNLSFAEIESVTVLKDAAATVLYGQNGANGVVLITTKRGSRSGKNRINVNARWGIQKPTYMPSLLGNGDYAEMYNQALLSDGKDISSGYFKSPDIVNYFKDGSQPYLYPNVDWYKEIVKKQSFVQEYQATLTGGNRTASYFIAMDYRDDQGLYANTDSKRSINSNLDLRRYGLRANVDMTLSKMFSAEVNLRGTMEDKMAPNVSDATIWKTMALFNPYPVRNEDGTWGGKEGYAANPVAQILQQGYTMVNERTVDAGVKLKADFSEYVKGLSAFGQIYFSNNYWSYYNKTRGFAYTELTPDLTNIQDGVIPYTSTVKGDTDTGFDISQPSGNQWNRNTVLAGMEYERTFNEHSIYASAMYRQYKYKAKGADQFYAQQAIIGRVRYDYAKKYFAEFGYAYNGTENFPKHHRFGFFPSLSAAWLVSNEDFLKENSTVNFLKFRASAGLVGNGLPGNAGRLLFYQYYGSGSSYLFGKDYTNGKQTFQQLTLANKDVTWEKAMKYNVGVDALLWKRLSLSLDYFYEYRSDIAVNPSNYLPAIIGANFFYVNAGKVKNHGFESDINYTDKFGDVGVTLGGRFSFSRSNIVDIKEAPQAFDYLYQKGHSIGQPFMLQAIGFYKDEADIATSPVSQYGTVKPGDIKYKDQNGDNLIDDNDRIAHGYSSVPEIYYGIDLGLTYKGFDFSVWTYGSAHRGVSMLDYNNCVPFLNGGTRPTQWVKDNYWTPERGDQAKFPRLTTEANPNNYRASTLWYRNGSFFRVKNIELGYTLPASLINKMKLKQLRIYANVNDPFAFASSKDIDLDPECRNMFGYPALRSIDFGLSLSF